MAKLIGDAGFSWTDPDTGAQTHALRVPLTRVRPAHKLTQHVAESADLTVREVTTTGKAHEAVALVRYDDDPASLAELVMAGSRGITLTYIQNVTAGTPTIDLVLVAPGADWVAALDEFPAAFREYTTELRFRRTDGSAFPDWFFED